jgi:anti-anti-sigma factor
MRSEEGNGNTAAARRGPLLRDFAATKLGTRCWMRTESRLHTVVIRVYGDLEESCEQPFRQELGRALDNETWTVIVDLRDLTFIDPAGLRLLTELNQLARADAFELAFLSSSGAVKSSLAEAGLDERLPVVDPGATVTLPAGP